MNEIGFVDYPNTVTKDCLATFFRCEQTGMKVRNLRLFCAMMSALASYGYIGRYWQAPIYKCQLLVAYKKGGYIGRSDLTTAHHAINSVITVSYTHLAARCEEGNINHQPTCR